MVRVVAVACAASVAAIVLQGCGGSGDDGSNSTPSPHVVTTSPADVITTRADVTTTPAPATTEEATRLPEWLDLRDFALQALDALVEDPKQGGFMRCVVLSRSAIQDLAVIKDDVAKHNATAVLSDLTSFIHALSDDVDGCKPIVDDFKADIAFLQNVSGIAGLLKNIEYNLGHTYDKISGDLHGAAQAIQNNDSVALGMNLGSAFHHIIMGAYPDEVVV